MNQYLLLFGCYNVMTFSFRNVNKAAGKLQCIKAFHVQPKTVCHLFDEQVV